MTFSELTSLAQSVGFTNWAKLNIETLDLKPEVRQMCASNSCGQYGKRWSCPPGCGSLEECRKKVADMHHGILVQTVGPVEDGFDFEAMEELNTLHKERFERMYHLLREAGVDTLPLGAGCCTRCKDCTYPDHPCRFPQERIASMEAYGLLVSEVCKANGMQYYYGSDKIAYTSCFLLK